MSDTADLAPVSNAGSGAGTPARAAPAQPWLWMGAAVLVTAAIAAALRFGTPIATLGPRFDEQWIRIPVDALVREGWSVSRAIDFEETKGPGLVWPYALFGAVAGGELGTLRLLTVLWFVLGVIPLAAIAQRCGVRRWGVVAVAILYCLLPQQAVLGQLLMSEPLFVTGSLALLWAFLWSFEPAAAEATPPSARARRRRIAGPVLFALLLSVLLHTRIHAVAFAAAACLVAFERDRWRSWPWWLAALLAGLSRLPLAARWGGLVSPMYRQMHQLGEGGDLLQLANATYLLAALAPCAAVFLWPALRGPSADAPSVRPARWLVLAGAGAGLVLALLAPPWPSDRLPAPPLWAERAPEGLPRFLGLAATAARSVATGELGQVAILGAGAVLGGAALGALAALGWAKGVRPTSDEQGLATAARLTVWTLASGIGLYGIAQAFVLDRYLLPWLALAPILWWRWLPRWLCAAQAAMLLALAAYWVRLWLMLR